MDAKDRISSYRLKKVMDFYGSKRKTYWYVQRKLGNVGKKYDSNLPNKFGIVECCWRI